MGYNIYNKISCILCDHNHIFLIIAIQFRLFSNNFNDRVLNPPKWNTVIISFA